MQRRSGLSFVEFVGCSVALVGGAAIGATYLGYDLKHVAVQALERSQVVDPKTFGLEAWPGAADPTGGPGTSSGSEPHRAESGRETAPSFAPETSYPRTGDGFPNNIDARTGLAASNDPNIGNRTGADPLSSRASRAAAAHRVEATAVRRDAATKAYWEAFAACAYSELNGLPPDYNHHRWQVLDYISARQKAHRSAADALRQLDRQGVDPRLLAHVDTVRGWHAAGDKLFGRAVDLLTNGPRALTTGPLAQSWQSAATQHRMEERLVRNKHQVAVTYLNHAYKSLGPFSPAFPD